MKAFVIILALTLAAPAQTPVSQTAGPPPAPFVTLLDYDGSGNLIYTGVAPQFLQNANSWLKRSDSTLTNIVVATNTATATCATDCGVWAGQRVTVSGATVDAQLNATYTVLTVPTSTTFTFTTANVSDATYNESTLKITTNNPLTTQSLWTVTALKYNGSNQLIGTPFANSCTAAGGCIAWSNRTSY